MIAKLQDGDDGENYSYSALFSSSSLARERVRQKFLEFLKSIQLDLTEQKVEDVFQINFDICKWSN